MKRLVFVLLAVFSFTISYSQNNWYLVKDYLTTEEKNYTENDLDNAFAAPLSKFVGKKWYQSWYNDEVRYIIFNNNKTGAIVNEFTDNDYTYPIKAIKKIFFKWKRDGNDLTITLTPHLDVITPIESSMTKLSPRVKAEVRKDYAKSQAYMRAKKYADYDSYDCIIKITNDIFIWGGNMYVSKKKLDELMLKQKNE